MPLPPGFRGCIDEVWSLIFHMSCGQVEGRQTERSLRKICLGSLLDFDQKHICWFDAKVYRAVGFRQVRGTSGIEVINARTF